MVDSGELHIRDYLKIRKSVDLYKLTVASSASLDILSNVWHWGPAGVGKSRHVRESYPDGFIKSLNKWWDGYDNHETVIIEDIDKTHACLAYHLKIWADHYPFPGETKGST